jgi:hypothetical protein
MLLVVGRAGLFHRVEHDADEQVEDEEARNDRVADEEQDRPAGQLHAHRDVVGQVLQRQHDEHRQHRVADVSIARGVVLGEEHPADHPVDVDQQHGRGGQ